MVWGADIWGIWVGYSRSFPASDECASFLPQCKMKMEARHRIPAA
jgi:hypothetical protein